MKGLIEKQYPPHEERDVAAFVECGTQSAEPGWDATAGGSQQTVTGRSQFAGRRGERHFHGRTQATKRLAAGATPIALPLAVFPPAIVQQT